MKFLFVFLLIWPSVLLASETTVKYKFRGVDIAVPSKYVADFSLLAILKSYARLDDDSGSFTLVIKPAELSETVSSYVGYVDGVEQVVRVSVFDVYDETPRKLLSSDRYAGAWYATNGYENREIISHTKDGWLMLFGSKGYRGDFLVLSQSPETGKNMPDNVRDFLVARCFGSNSQPFKKVTCSSKFLVEGGILVDISYSFENIEHIEKIEKFVQDKLAAWVDVN